MSDDDERAALADRLRALSLPELVDVLHRVLPAHDDQAWHNGLRRSLVLAEVTRFDETVPLDADDPRVIVQLVAWPDRDHYDGGFGPEPDITQGGHCHRCDIEVASTAKRAFCPACGAVCHLT